MGAQDFLGVQGRRRNPGSFLPVDGVRLDHVQPACRKVSSSAWGGVVVWDLSQALITQLHLQD